MILAFISVYVVLQLGLGVVVSRRVQTEEDYLVAGRSLGPALATASVFATWFGAETCVGAAGAVYEQGLFGVAADPFGYGLCLVLFGLVVARPLWRARVTTLADIYGTRFTPGVERVVAILMIPTSLLWAAAQMRAFGTVVASTTTVLDVEAGLVLAAVVTVAYTSLGGLLADAWTDLIQGGVLVSCLVVIAVVALLEPGATEALVLGAGQAAEAEGPGVFAHLDAWAIPILGSLFAQELAARAAASRSESLARRAAVGAGAMYLVVGLIPVGLGLLARTQLPELEEPEAALPAMAERHLGPVGQGIFAGALVSAILSTIDSALLAASGLVTHNLGPVLSAIWQRFGRLEPSPKRALLSARLGVVALGALAFVLARGRDSVHGLVEEASAFGSAGFVVTGFAVLFFRRGGPRAAYLTLVAGAVGYIVFEYGLSFEASFLASLGLAGAGWFLGAAFETRSEKK